MAIWLALTLAVAALFCLPDPGEKTPVIFGVPAIMWLLAAGLTLFAVVRFVRVCDAFYQAWEWLCDLYWKWP